MYDSEGDLRRPYSVEIKLLWKSSLIHNLGQVCHHGGDAAYQFSCLYLTIQGGWYQRGKDQP